MDLDNQFLFFFSALGVFNGLLLSIYLIFFIKPKRVANYFLGSLLLMLSVRIGKSVLHLFFKGLPKIYLQIGLSACFLIGPFLFFYLFSVVKQKDTIGKNWKIHIGILLFIIVTVGTIYPYQTQPELWNTFVIVIYLQWIAYIVAAGFVLKSILKKVITHPRSLNTVEIWLLLVYIGNAIICLAFNLALFTSLYIFGSLAFSILFYTLVFFLLFRKNRAAIFFEAPSKYANKKIETTKATLLLKKLEQVMNEKQLYKNPYLKLNDVAKELNIMGHRLSQLLNDNLGKSFSLFVNEYRVQEAKQLLISKDNYSLEAIGDEAGFSSKSSFYATFKKLTQHTPMGYKKSKG